MSSGDQYSASELMRQFVLASRDWVREAAELHEATGDLLTKLEREIEVVGKQLERIDLGLVETHRDLTAMIQAAMRKH